jgi:hypothetical protein
MSDQAPAAEKSLSEQVSEANAAADAAKAAMAEARAKVVAAQRSLTLAMAEESEENGLRHSMPVSTGELHNASQGK